jgi:hypothetical protein
MLGTSLFCGAPKHDACKIITIAKRISYARVRVESRSKDGNFDHVETAYAAGMGLV